jgi:hypothetical protein
MLSKKYGLGSCHFEQSEKSVCCYERNDISEFLSRYSFMFLERSPLSPVFLFLAIKAFLIFCFFLHL